MLLFSQEVKMSENKIKNKSKELETSTKAQPKTNLESKKTAQSKLPLEAQPKTKPQTQSKMDPKELKSKTNSKEAKPKSIQLSGLYAFKLAMSSIYNEKGHFVPVTFLKFHPWRVSQLKNKKKDSYTAVQLACKPQKNNRCSKALVSHLKQAGFKQGAAIVREIRGEFPNSIELGQFLSIHSVKKGDVVTLSGVSKGAGFAGVVKRWGFKGGPASHGAKMHRRSGSIGNRTEPARVMPGKKMAGHKGNKKVSLRSVKVLDVVEAKHLVIVKGAVPGARGCLVYLQKPLQNRGEK